MRLFFDTSVLLAACGSPTGASREVVRLAQLNGWILIATSYVISEVQNNLGDFAPSASAEWTRLERDLVVMRDVLSLDRPSVFTASKDRPILFSALAWADVLLTLDRGDFGAFLGTSCYGLYVLKPGDFLQRERSAGRLRTPEL